VWFLLPQTFFFRKDEKGRGLLFPPLLKKSGPRGPILDWKKSSFYRGGNFRLYGEEKTHAAEGEQGTTPLRQRTGEPPFAPV